MAIITSSTESFFVKENTTDLELLLSPSKVVTVEECTVAEALEMISLMSHGRVGVVCNTVANAKQMYERLRQIAPESWNLVLYHARFTVGHRLRRGEAVLGLVGKEAGDSIEELTVVVGTQVLEQSLDVDFDVLFTENAPIDLFLQRTGRLHRHESHNTFRLSQYANPRVYILNDTDALPPKGSQYIYGEYLLDATRDILSRTPELRIPQDIAPLLESVYGGLEGFESLYEEYMNTVAGLKSKANPYALGSPHDRTNMYGWIEGGAGSELMGQAKVRDGISGPEVILIEKNNNGEFFYHGEQGVTPLPLHAPSWREASDIRFSSITLPVYCNGEDFIRAIERLCEQAGIYDLWRYTPLEGEVAVILERGSAEILKRTIMYSNATGLEVNRV